MNVVITWSTKTAMAYRLSPNVTSALSVIPMKLYTYDKPKRDP